MGAYTRLIIRCCVVSSSFSVVVTVSIVRGGLSLDGGLVEFLGSVLSVFVDDTSMPCSGHPFNSIYVFVSAGA